jgi:hypothetical protein
MMAVRRAAFMPPVTPASTRAPLRPRSLSPRLRNSTSSRSLQHGKGMVYFSGQVTAVWWCSSKVRTNLLWCDVTLLPSSRVPQQCSAIL